MTLILVLLFLKNICVFLNKLVLRCYNSFLIHPPHGHLDGGKHGGYGGGGGGAGGGSGSGSGSGHSGFGSGLGVRPRRTRNRNNRPTEQQQQQLLMLNRDPAAFATYGDGNGLRPQYQQHYYNHY
ncbi:hypothetical protein AND_008218 [Anopheles darlingi]|uniref:Uncharacterized protein n=1 Tax=Anopheles darlingi TaxID=43151 RepID=W5J9W2_ANODA|nr:hypothetical protein AND_008218 [Anopheles darlingi]